MFLILGVNVKRLKGSEKTKEKTKSYKDMHPYTFVAFIVRTAFT